MPPARRHRGPHSMVDKYLLHGLRAPTCEANRGGGTPHLGIRRRGGGTPRLGNRRRGGGTPRLGNRRRPPLPEVVEPQVRDIGDPRVVVEHPILHMTTAATNTDITEVGEYLAR